MKTDAEAKSEDPSGAKDAEPSTMTNDDSPEGSQEGELDDLRRFRVRTVPPDMRRQWILAETPSVSPLDLQDTVPPTKPSASAPTEADATTPRPLYNTPRVSSTAKTMRLDRVVPKTIRLDRVVPRGERSTNLVVVVSILVAGAAVLWFMASGSTSRRATVAPTVPAIQQEAPQPEQAPTKRDDLPEIGGPLLPARATSSPEVHPSGSSQQGPIASPVTTDRRVETARKDPRTNAAPSGRIPAPKPKSESDIKTPLFGQ